VKNFKKLEKNFLPHSYTVENQCFKIFEFWWGKIPENFDFAMFLCQNNFWAPWSGYGQVAIGEVAL